MRTIIPAAGYGTRMNLKPGQSKEMLPDPSNGGLPMIQRTLDFAIDPLVIIRSDKLDLINYCKDKVECLLLKPSNDEWPVTVLRSRPHWERLNVLVLPDTNLTSVDYHTVRLKAEKLMFAVHSVEDVSQWGHVTIDKTEEKPLLGGNGWAWGCIGFSDMIGEALFSSYANKTPFYFKPGSVDYAHLSSGFKDRTRNGVLE